MNGAFASLSSEQLRRAVAIKEQIEALERELNAILQGAGGPQAAAPPPVAPARKVRMVTAAARPAAGTTGSPATTAAQETSPRPKRRAISPEGKRRIIEAQRRRWAAWRAARRAEQRGQQK